MVEIAASSAANEVTMVVRSVDAVQLIVRCQSFGCGEPVMVVFELD